MAFAATVAWEVRTGGSDSNGGGFDPTSGTPGTDRSQQDAAFQTYTDLVIDAATNTKMTSAAHPFTAADVGNIVNITSGTGFTVQRVQIMSVAANVATVDKSLGTLGSTGGNGNLGGGLLTIAKAFSLAVALNSIYVANGTYTQTAVLTAPTVIFKLFGYNTSHTDFTGTTLITMNTSNNANLIACGNGTAMVATNIQFQFTGNTSNTNILVAATSSNSIALFKHCYFDAGSVSGGNTRTAGVNDAAGQFIGLVFDDCKFDRFHNFSAGQDGSCIFSGQAVVRNCYFHDFVYGVLSRTDTTGRQFYVVENCIFDAGTVSGGACLLDQHSTGAPRYPASWIVRNCAFTGSSTIALNTSGAPFTNNDTAGTGSTISFLVWENNVVYSVSKAVSINGSQTNAQPALINRDNAYGALGGANVNWTGDASDITLTASPWTNTATPDFSLNATAGGGPLCKSAGFPGALQAGGTGFEDVGPLRHQDPASGTTIIPISVTQNRFVKEEYASDL